MFILGVLLTTKLRHCIVICPYGVLTFTLFILNYAIGAIVMAAGCKSDLAPLTPFTVYGSQAFTDYCTDNNWDYWKNWQLHEFVLQMEDTYIELDKQLLCNDICPCGYNVNETTITNSTVIEGRNFTTIGNNTNLNQCLKDNDYSYKWQYILIDYMRELEEEYGCTGLCSAYDLPMFTNFTGELPNTDYCYKHVSQELLSDVGDFGFLYFSSGTALFMAWFFQFGLCFRKNFKKKVKMYKMQEEMQRQWAMGATPM